MPGATRGPDRPDARLSASDCRGRVALAAATFAATLALAIASAGSTMAQEASIAVDSAAPTHRITRMMTGACLEDVNHEVYGGIYSQMIFGESFQEPPPPVPLKGFTAYEGSWTADNGVLDAGAGAGPKLISSSPPFAAGEVGVELLFPDGAGGNAGLVLKVSEPGNGADKFIGYEVSLTPGGTLVLHRHRHNWEPLHTIACNVPVGQWIPLSVKLGETSLEISVAGKLLLKYEDREHPLGAGRVGLRTWQRTAKFRNLWVATDGGRRALPFEHAETGLSAGPVSRMWQPVVRGAAQARFAIASKDAFVGAQSQAMAFLDGAGQVGIENRGLNRWGLCFRAKKPYEGHLWVRAEKRTEFSASLESGDGARVYAETCLTAASPGWQRLDFQLTPSENENAGRFAITLRRPGSIVLGYVFLQPGPWGRFKGLPVRDDVARALVDQGLTVLRYGGSMVNCPEYRWKKMIGPRDRRPPYRGTWYAHSTNGWGIVDFLDLCEAAGFAAIPAFSMDETPQDMADFLDYAAAPADSPWGRRRAADGHPQPYRLKYVQLGNEEAVNEDYWRRFQPMAEAIWAKDREITVVVGDFIYSQPIVDPYNFPGAPTIKSLAAHRKILDLARKHGREIWFDTHIGTDTPRDWQGLGGVPSFIDALAKLSPGARYQVAVFELNSGSHNVGRALGNARAIGELERIGDRVPVVCSANCLQPYRQNDNGWDQGLLFLSPSQVWGQPPYYVTQMLARHYLPNVLRVQVECPGKSLDVTATASDDAKTVQLQVVNLEGRTWKTSIRLKGFRPKRADAEVAELSGRLGDINTPEQPCRIVPKTSRWRHGMADDAASYTFPPHSFTILRFE